MDAPPVQYARTSDGYDIAFTDSGHGCPVVLLPFGYTHAQLSWESPTVAPLLRRLREHFRLVHYDGRGQGLSQRGLPPDFTLDSLELDLEAVLGKLHLERPILFGDHVWAHVAVRFAAAKPEQVSALILMRCRPSLGLMMTWLLPMLKESWDFFLRAQLSDDLLSAEQVQEGIQRLKAAVTHEDMVRMTEASAGSEIGALLSRLVMPVLVLHPDGQPWIAQEESAKVAALIPNGRLAVLRPFGVWGDPVDAIAAIAGFIDELPSAVATARGTRVAPTPLSSREEGVLRLLAAGRSNQQIADELVISLNTVRRHVSNIFDKTGAANRAQAAAFAKEHGLA